MSQLEVLISEQDSHNYEEQQRVHLPEITVSIPKKTDDDVIAYIEQWEDETNELSTLTKKVTDPRGLSLKMLQEIVDTFLTEDKVRLYHLISPVKSRGHVYEPGEVIAVMEPPTSSKFVDAVIPGSMDKIRIKFEKIVELPKDNWTIGQVIKYKLSHDYRETNSKSFYEQLNLTSQEDLGPYFEGAYCIVSRQSNFVKLVTRVIDKANEDGIDFVYFDFLAVNRAEREILRKELEERRDERTKFIQQTCPLLVNSFDKIYVYIDDWRNATVFSRGWCMFELYWAFNKQISVEVVYPPEVVTSFESAVTDEFRNDYFSYHDTCSTIFSSFDHLSFTDLRIGSVMDNEIISQIFIELDNVAQNKRDKNKKQTAHVKTVLRSNLLYHFAKIVVSIGNMNLQVLATAIASKNREEVGRIVNILRKCGFYLRRADFNIQAVHMFRFCRYAVERYPQQTLDQVFIKSKNIMRLKYDIAKSYSRELITVQHIDNKEVKQGYTVEGLNYIVEANLAKKIAIAAFLLKNLILMVEEREITLTPDQEVEAMEILPSIEEELIAFSKESLQQQMRNKAFQQDSIVFLMRNSNLSPGLLECFLEFSRESVQSNEGILMFEGDSQYTEYVFELAISDIDLQKQTFEELNQVAKSVQKCFFSCEKALKEVAKARKDEDVIEQEIYLKLDHVRVLFRSTNSNDRIKLAVLLEELRAGMQRRINFVKKSEKFQGDAKTNELQHANTTFALILNLVGKFFFKYDVRPAADCTEMLQQGLRHLEGISTNRANTLRTEIQTQIDIIVERDTFAKGKEKSFFSERVFVTSTRRFMLNNLPLMVSKGRSQHISD